MLFRSHPEVVLLACLRSLSCCRTQVGSSLRSPTDVLLQELLVVFQVLMELSERFSFVPDVLLMSSW